MKILKNEDNYVVITFPTVLARVLPLWMVLIIVLNSSMVVGFAQYYILKKQFNQGLQVLSEKAASPEELVQKIKEEVIPQKGYQLGVSWEEIGVQLLESGVIDRVKYEELFSNDRYAQEQMEYLVEYSTDHMRIDETNAHFMVNTLWALGLVNKSPILDEGSMMTAGEGNPMAYASTGGWTLGTQQTPELYSSQTLVSLNQDQVEQVRKIAENVYRPCCNNHSEFPDCNHGMAALGYIELAISQGVSEEQIYKDLLALNSYWFPQTYVDIAYYLEQEGKNWDDSSPKDLLSKTYSSAQGSQLIKQSLQNIPGFESTGGGCSV